VPDVTLTMDAAIDRYMLDPSTTRRRRSKSLGQKTAFAAPVSSSIGRNMTPFADLGI
jgi:hypothetical protein